MMLLFFELQYQGYMNQYDTLYPPNAVILNEYVISFIEFQVISPERLAQLVDPDFTIIGFVANTQDALNGEVVKDVQLIVIMLSVGGTVVLVMIIIAIIPKYRQKMITKLKDLKDGFIFNGFIRSTRISYIKICILIGNVV